MSGRRFDPNSLLHLQATRCRVRSLLTDELRARLDDPDSVLPDDATQVVSLLAISDNGP